MRVALFFDGNNFYRSMGPYVEGLELDYDQLAIWATRQVGGDSAEFMGAYYYTGFSAQSGLDRFLKGLELRRGFFVRREPVVERIFHCPHCEVELRQRAEKRVDTRLVAEMIKMAAIDAFDRAIVFSGDEDLVPALDTVSELGKQVYVATWGGRSLSPNLRIHSFGTIDLLDGLDEFTTGRTRQTEEQVCDIQPDPEATLEDLYLQLKEAWSYFAGRNGHVSRWYFENRWKPSGPCPPPGLIRQHLLDLLIQKGKVEVFEATVNGRAVLAIRPAPNL